MDPFEPQLVLKKEVRFPDYSSEANSNHDENLGDAFGGMIKSGQWGWLTKGADLRIICLRTGQLISKYVFDESQGFGMCIISCVSEVQMPYVTGTIIAVGIQYTDSPGGLVAIYSVEDSEVIRCIELKHKITCCKFINHEAAQHTALQNMNGCVAVGSDCGKVLLVDLNMRVDELNMSVRTDSAVSVVPCHVVDYSMSLLHLHRHFQHCQQEGVHFGIQLEVLENATFVQSLLPIDLILSLAVGLADGRLVLYDLTDMQVFYVAPPQDKFSPLVKMDFIEPPDDPRLCLYIWAFHENYQNSMAVLHSLMYEKRVMTEDGFSFFENFQVSCVRLLLPLSCPKCVPITCQTITKSPSHGNEDTLALCALVWKQDQETKTEVLLFDINQWYKEEMPYVGDWREEPSYLASFVLPDFNSLDTYFNPNTMSLFNSIQRLEEHFYPTSLSFDAVALGENGCAYVNWPGAQNRLIDFLRLKGSMALLDPNPIFREILNTRLLPQFSGHNYRSTFSLKAKREAILSVAIEQNCIGLLKECAKYWSDGSHQGKSLSESLSLSTLTDWLWSRATSIKERCNDLCQVLFDHSGCTLDQREQKELGYISKQLKTLADLLSDIITKYGERIPSDALTTLESQCKSIKMASDYQEILLWLLNIGLLPEGPQHGRPELNLVPYPYESLRRFYGNRRLEFAQLNQKPTTRKPRSCYLLFIDSFIEHEFQGNSLRDCWLESGGNGLYPPPSTQAMLRTMLIPDVLFDYKCALFLYYFLDLNMAIEDKRYEPIVQNFIKFPSVFRLSASLIKQIQAFWNLDHCRFQAAVDEFISPFNKDQVCPQWQLELFVESLLIQNEPNLALRVLEAKSSPISPVLQLNTYLANDLISEAFHFARSKQDEDLLRLFFSGCLCAGKFGVIRDLALTENEGNLVQSLLKSSKSRNAENLHFVYLLQKYKYIEAVSYLDELSRGRVAQRAADVDTPSLVLSAYNTTMTPVTKGLSDVYFKIKNKIKSKETEQSSPYPFSCQLLKQNANDLLGGIYHSSALGTHFATQYWDRNKPEGHALQHSSNAPFLRRPQISTYYSDYSRSQAISYPDVYKAASKRRLDSSPLDENRGSKIRENPTKRRRVYYQADLETAYKPAVKGVSATENLLTQFKSTPSRSKDEPDYAKKLHKDPPPESTFFLETPYIKETNVETSKGVSSTRAAERSETPLHGILKASHSSQKSDDALSFEADKKSKKDTEEEKSIRFILPVIEDESEGQEDEPTDVPMETDDIEENEVSPETNKYSISKRKALRSSVDYKPIGRVFRSRSPLRKSLSKEREVQSLPKYIAPTVDTEKEQPEVISEQKQPSPVVESLATKEVSSTDEEQPMSNLDKARFRALKDQLSNSLKSRSPIRSKSVEIGEPISSETLPKETIIPIVLVEDTDIVKEVSQAKRALSESSDDRTCDSTQRGAKQLKGRASIHSDSKTSSSSSSELEEQQPTDAVPRTDTMIDFTPHMSSSKVCATQSLFTSDIPSTSFHSEKITSKVVFSERSTVVGGLSTLPTMETTTNVTDSTTISIQPRDQMLDTTVDMTLYDTMQFDRSFQRGGSEDSFSDRSPSPSDPQVVHDGSDNSSVILLSSRSNSVKSDNSADLYGTNLSYSESVQQRKPMTGQIVIDDEGDDDDNDDYDESDGVDIVDNSSENTGSFSNESSEASVTRASTSYTIQSNTDTVQSSVIELGADEVSCDQPQLREVEEGEASDENAREGNPEPDSTSGKDQEPPVLVEDDSFEALIVEPDDQESVKEIYESSVLVTAEEKEDLSEERECSHVSGDDNRQKEGDAPQPSISEDHGHDEETEAKKIKLSDLVEDVVEEPVVIEIIASESSIAQEKDPDEQSKEPEEESPLEVISSTETTESDEKRYKESQIEGEQQPEVDVLPTQSTKDDEQPHKDAQIEGEERPELTTQTSESIEDEDRRKLQLLEEESTPRHRGGRSKSVAKHILPQTEIPPSPSSATRRQSRAESMPPVAANQIVTRRRSILLDEVGTPDSPSSRTRSKLRLDSVDAEVDSPSVSSAKRNRLSSVTSVDALQTPTARRRNSMSVDKELQAETVSTPTRTRRTRSITSETASISTPVKTPRRLSTSKKSQSPSEAKSNTTEETTKEQTEKDDKQGEQQINEDYASSRRLTRTQLAIMEKSAALAKMAHISPAKIAKRRSSRAREKESPASVDDKGSDSASVSSYISHLSNSTTSRRITRSVTLREHADDDIASVASSTESGKRTRKRAGKDLISPNTTLTAIPEEGPSGSEGSVSNADSSKRSRRQKK